MLLDPRMVGGTLQREVERDLQTQLMGVGHERLEVVHRTQQRVHRVMAAELGADAERGARVVRAGHKRIVAALAVGHADREDRRQVDDVEPLFGGTVQTGERGLEIALHDRAVLGAVRAFRTREELVPGGEAGLRTLDLETLRAAFGDAVAQRVRLVQRLDARVVGLGKPGGGRTLLVRHAFGGLLQMLAVAGGQVRVRGVRPTVEHLGAGFQGVLHVVADLHLDAGVVQPRGVGILPTLDGDGPLAQLALDGGIVLIPRLQVAVLAGLEHDGPAVETGVHAGHGGALHLTAARIAQHGGGTDLGASLDEHLRRDLERLAQFDARREHALLGARGHVHDHDAAERGRGAGLGGGGNLAGSHRLRRGGMRGGGRLSPRRALARAPLRSGFLTGGALGSAVVCCHTAHCRAGVPTVGRGCGIWTRAGESRHRRVLRLWICGRSTDAAAVECAQPQQRVVHNTPASLIVRPHLHEPLPCRAQPWQARE